MNPLISVIVPCYQQAQYLDECLQSVYDQTYPHWECIIVNDGSPDHTEEVAQRWLAKDRRFRYHYKENGGLSSARNAGIREAKGEWIQFLDSDDILRKTKFETITNLRNISFYDVIITNFELLSKNKILPPFCNLNSIKIDLKTIILEWDLEFTIPIHCALFNKKSLGNIRFSELLIAKEDWIFWIDFFKDHKEYFYINDKKVLYRINPLSLGTNSKHISIANNYIFNNYDENIKALIFKKINDNETKLRDSLKICKNDLNVVLSKPLIRLYFTLKNKLLK